MLNTTTDPSFEALLDYLKRSRGFDFTGYKRTSLIRRVDKRMQMVGVETYTDYLDYLQVHPDEFAQLFNIILINVTSFFRDPIAWELMAQSVLPRILEAKTSEEPIRAWIAGCASGEEAYTLTILLAEAMGLEQFRSRVKIYATDIDEEALNQARQASFTARETAGIPEELLEKYFERVGPRYVFHKDLRRVVIFGRHDLMSDAPISRIDILTCRNALMYFNSEAQAKILGRLHFALNDDGFLMLGKAEMLFTHANLFTPFDLKRRIFTKIQRNLIPDRLIVDLNTRRNQEMDQIDSQRRLREVAFSTGSTATIAVDLNGILALASDRACALFRLTQKDVGRPLQDLEISYRPLELRSIIEQVLLERRAVTHKDVIFPTGIGEPIYLDIQVLPLIEKNGMQLGTSVTFSDVTRYKQLQEELQESNRELETAYEELQSTNEELETTNEELQSTVEELETTNEELQSTNEELETMNEELQSTNEELQTINEELRQRSIELNQVNGFMNSILSCLRSGVVVIDQDMQIEVWSPKMEDLWGLRSSEVQGVHLLNLDMGLPVEQLKAPIRDCLSGKSKDVQITLEARNRRGKAIQCHVICTPLQEMGTGFSGVILLMDELPITP